MAAMALFGASKEATTATVHSGGHSHHHSPRRIPRFIPPLYLFASLRINTHLLLLFFFFIVC